MKKVLILVVTFALVLSLCSCRKANENYSSTFSDTSSDFEYLTNSNYEENSREIDTSDVSQSENSKVASNKEENAQTNSQQDTTKNNSEVTKTETSSNDEVIDFVPNTIKKSPTSASDDTYISLSCEVYYKNQKYAYALGMSNGVACGAVIVVNDNDEYLKCVTLLEGDERGVLTVYNDRIYYLSCPLNDEREPKLLNTLSVYSMNLSGKEKRKETEISIPFTSVNGINFISNSKYWIFSVANNFDGSDDLYRYDVITKEFKKLGKTPKNNESVYINGEQVFLSSSHGLYKTDINYENKQLFFDFSYLTDGFSFIEGTENGFIIEIADIGNKYFLDLSGNLTQM